MMQAIITFVTPLLLVGVLAAGVPLVLHLLSSVRAQEVLFPTLRFLRLSMEKTARRRRIQHLLLLIVRAAMLALLAAAVAEPISQAVGGWLEGNRYAAVVVLDNSYSMAVRKDSSSRFAQAKNEAAALLSGDDKPSLAAFMTTAGGFASKELTTQLDSLRESLSRTSIGYGPAALAQRVGSAVELLQGQSAPRKAVYVFTDLQRSSCEEFPAMKALAQAPDVHLFFINVGSEEVANVGIGELEVSGQRVVDNVLEFAATLVNSSATDRVVDVGMRIEGAELRQRIRKTLRPAGQDGSSAVVKFHHRFSQAGPAAGEIFIETDDDLPVDNVRRFSLDIGGRVRALLVRAAAGAPPGGMDPAMMLSVALEPWDDRSSPWSITSKVIEAGRLTAEELGQSDAAFFCDVPSFTAEQAQAIARFVGDGGTAAFFLGPGVEAGNYNERFIDGVPNQGGLLPGRLEAPVGEVGPNAPAFAAQWVDAEHPYLQGLYENLRDYLTVQAQRYYRLRPSVQAGRLLIRLDNGDGLAWVKDFGKGRVLFCATTASPSWTNLPITGLFLPMVTRASMLARQELWRDSSYPAGAQVAVRPGRLEGDASKAVINISLPAGEGEKAPPTAAVAVRKTAEGLIATFTDTWRVGTYHWQASLPGLDGKPVSGRFVVNPFGPECRLAAYASAAFQKALRQHGLERAYAGSSTAEVHASAAHAAQGHNWWDLLVAITVLLLVVEAVVANRRGRAADIIPQHLNPKLA